MLPEFYLTYLDSQLSASQLLTLEMLVWLLQFHKQVRIERLASCLPLPILYESEGIEKTDSTAQQFLDRFVRANVDCCPRILSRLD
jgi:hypothetical protein